MTSLIELCILPIEVVYDGAADCRTFERIVVTAGFPP